MTPEGRVIEVHSGASGQQKTSAGCQVYVKIVVNFAKLAMQSMTAKSAKQALCQLKGSSLA